MNIETPLEANNWLQASRHRMINMLLGSVVLLGTLGIIVAVYRVWQTGFERISFTLAYYLGAYGLVLMLYFVRQIPDHWRAIGFLALVYVFSLFALYSGWLGGSGRVLLLPLIVLAAILIGPQAGVIAAILSLASFAFFGLAFSQGWFVYGLAPILGDPGITLIEEIGFAMAVGMVSIGVWFLRRGLEAATLAILETQKARSMLSDRAIELDAANQMLAERSQVLQSANQELEIQNWLNVGESELNGVLRGEQTVSSLADHVLIQLCRYLNFPVGALFMLENGFLKRIGKYAFPAGANLKDSFELGEGLVGQAALEKRILTVRDIPSDGLTISSGLGQASPVVLLIVPLMFSDRVCGVMEFGASDDDLERRISFLEKVRESIAIAFNTAQDRARIDHLLSEMQRQASELQIQEEELHAANEELIAQAVVLRTERYRTDPTDEPRDA